ncbi:hypothetical protein PRK78_004025 [Emydomyces testavorans]|uniref:Uncharacterized protein n=1 Tax=Emydomyces testavorans TaxID=2070801 RepID=A0AAF0IJ46_9EURO|nr:hypothetical protein PRK78_004025 [Emydomyces testavorans]
MSEDDWPSSLTLLLAAFSRKLKAKKAIPDDDYVPIDEQTLSKVLPYCLESLAMSSPETAPVVAPVPAVPPKGMRKNGKNWHDAKAPFRPTKGQTSYARRLEERKAMVALKEKEREMKEEKEAERQRRIQAIKDRRAAKEEKERTPTSSTPKILIMDPPQPETQKLPTFSPIHRSGTRQTPNPTAASDKPKHHRHHSHRAYLHTPFHHSLYAPEEVWLQPGHLTARAGPYKEQRDLGANLDGPVVEKYRRLRPHRRHRSHDGRLAGRSRRTEVQVEEPRVVSLENEGLEAETPSLEEDTTQGIGNEFEMDNVIRLPFVRRKEYIRQEDVEKRREIRKQAEKSNSLALSSIADRSVAFSQRLDTTYYNLLDRLSSIRSTIHSFHNLRTLTTNLNTDFNREATNLVQDTRRQITDFQAFAPQIRKIEALERRMNSCRETALQLDKRLETVREQIEAWDRKEVEWQRSVSRRLRILWAVMGTVLLLVAAVGLVERFKPSLVSMERTEAVERSNVVGDGSTGNVTRCPAGASFLDVKARNKTLARPLLDLDTGDLCPNSESRVPSGASRQKDPEEKIRRVLDEL